MQTALVGTLRTNVSPRDGTHDVGLGCKISTLDQGLELGCLHLAGSSCVRLLHMDTDWSWGNRDLVSLLTFLNQMELQTNWANDAKDSILRPNGAIWFPRGYLPLITALPCEGEKSVQRRPVLAAHALQTRVELTDSDEQNGNQRLCQDGVRAILRQSERLGRTGRHRFRSLWSIVWAELGNWSNTCRQSGRLSEILSGISD